MNQSGSMLLLLLGWRVSHWVRSLLSHHPVFLWVAVACQADIVLDVAHRPLRETHVKDLRHSVLFTLGPKSVPSHRQISQPCKGMCPFWRWSHFSSQFCEQRMCRCFRTVDVSTKTLSSIWFVANCASQSRLQACRINAQSTGPKCSAAKSEYLCLLWSEFDGSI